MTDRSQILFVKMQNLAAVAEELEDVRRRYEACSHPTTLTNARLSEIVELEYCLQSLKHRLDHVQHDLCEELARAGSATTSVSGARVN